ncbi:MAG: hypothetical protein LKJ05_02825 [Bifidobacteriaceae bacterium]|jgi:hypothetical protein|nr:hypothetical protein [Bifidobacteriaceae bacterium]
MADTSVGSIRGELELGVSDWMESIGKAKTAVDSLKDTDDITLDADVSRALAKIEEVRASAAALSDDRLAGPSVSGDSSDAIAKSKAVAAATRDLDAANQGVAASYQKLDEAQSAAGEGSSRYLTAQAGLTRSLNQQHSAFDKLNTAIDTEKTKLSQSESATNNDAKAKATHATETNRDAQSQNSLLSALIPLAPALVPIAAGAVGVGAALGGMAITGVAAIMGVKAAMAQGTATGDAYNRDLTALKVSMSGLASTAAAGALEGFHRSVSAINADMPVTNRLVALMAQDAGRITGNGVAGFLGILNNLQPVIQQVDAWLVRGSESFAQWGTGNGAKEFVAYLLGALPGVENTLSSLFTAAGHIVQAFAPWGSIVLTAVTTVGNAISAIPAPILTTLAVGGMAVFTAFKAWSAISGIITGVKTALVGMAAATGIAAGPIGLVVAGIGLLAGACAAFSSSSQSATDAQTDFTSALQQSNGALDENVRAQAAKQLQDAGAIDKAKQLGISTQELVDAALGEGDAYDTVSNKLQKTADAHKNATSAGAMGVTTWDSEGRAAQDLSSALATTHDGLSNAVQDQKELDDATKGSMASSTGEQTILGVTSDKFNQLSTATNNATTAANNYKTALDILNGGAQAVEASQIKLSQDFTNGASTIQSNIKSTDKATATSMDVNTKYGAANRQTILGMIQDSQQLADSIIKNGKDDEATRQKANASLTQSKQKILEFAAANGLSESAVKKMLASMDQYNAKDVPAKTIKVTDLASKVFEAVGLKAKSIKNGKVTISGNNKAAMAAISQVTGAKINKKTGTVTMNKKQYDVALAVANGAKLDTKTGYLLGNNSDAFRKFAAAQGWKIDPKTGHIKGENGDFMAKKRAVENTTIAGKKVNVSAEPSSFWGTMGGILSHIFSVNVGVNASKHAGGGEIKGPGTGTSDSVPIYASAGEHMLTADDVNAMGGQKAVYAFRSSLHSGRTADTSSLGVGSVSKTRTATQTTLPSTITLVDADGSLLGHMKVIAGQAVTQQNKSLRRSLING